MNTFTKSARVEQDLKWAHIWFGILSTFHGQKGNQDWPFSTDDVILLLRSRRDTGVPAWKRMRIIESLMIYQRRVQGRSNEELKPLQTKMREIIRIERARQEGTTTIKEATGFINPKESDAIQEFRRALRKDGMRLETERSYVSKLKAFMADRGLARLSEFDRIGGADVESHLTDLAVDGNVAASTQNAAFHGLLKFFTLVLKRDMGRIEAIRANKGKQIPTVLSPPEVCRVFRGLKGKGLVIAQLLYGCGMRHSEVLRLRLKDLDFANLQIEIHQSKGGKSRLVPMPNELVEPLQRWVNSRTVLHRHDEADGTASVWLPHALAKKYPNAHCELKWQYLFASDRLSRDPRTRRWHRHHLHSGTFPAQLRLAVEAAGLIKHVTSHTFRHCFATHLLWEGTDIRTIQRLLGHSDVKTTEIYTHARNPKESTVVSPLDRLKATA